MARNKSTIYLGYDDEEINPKYGQLNSTVNKIGGKADWPSSDIKVSSCGFCGMSRPLIIQLYAPLEHSQFHRTLYIFACLNPACSQNSKSWTCIRVQHLDSSDINGANSSGAKTKKKVKNSPAINWCSGTDDWGQLDDETQQIDREVDEAEQQRSNNEENGNVIGKDICLKKADEESDGDDDDSHSMENELICGFGNLDVHACPQNLKEDPNANCASGLAVADANTFGATSLSFAEIEGAETDVVLVETPEKPGRDLAAILKHSHASTLGSLNKIKDITLKSFFIAVDIEQRQILDEYEHYVGSLSADHIRDIYQEYKRQDEGEISPNGGKSVDVSNVESPESYEKAQPAHGDIIFHEFLTTIQRNPGQVIRYTRDSLPLLISPLAEALPKCPNCNEDTICEVQILPTLIPKLRLNQNDEAAPIEYGNVLIFTCLKSCWDTPDKLRYERVIVQIEK